jgi:4-amino-4-deoxy-L-arabinose transferase-like glycosyltransferase
MLAQNKNNFLFYYAILAVIIYFGFFYGLGSYTLLNNNEGLYASIAAGMLRIHSFIIPFLNCVPYIEKPPLLYWLLALSFSKFGLTAFAGRLVTSLSATITALSILFILRKFDQAKTGWIAALIFASSIGVAIIARMVYFDMLLTCLISLTLLALFYWYQKSSKFSLRLAYLFLALAILAKGLIAVVIVAGSFGLFLIWEKKLKEYLRLAFDWPGIILFLLVALPWHIAACFQHHGFFWNYIISEQFLRFLNLREPHDYYHGTIFYYLPRILIYLSPWSLFTPLIFWRSHNLNQFTRQILRFCWCWLLVPLLFFSLSAAKANYYMIVAMPALAIILSVKLHNLIEIGKEKILARWSFWIWIILTMCFVIVPIVILKTYPPLLSKINWIEILGVYCAASALITVIFARKSFLVLTLIAGLIIPAALTMIKSIPIFIDEISSAKVGIFLAQHPKKQIYIYQDFEKYSALAFYSGTCFKIIDSQSSDLYYGAHLPEFQNWFVNKEDLAKQFNPGSDYMIISIKKLTTFFQPSLKQTFLQSDLTIFN